MKSNIKINNKYFKRITNLFCKKNIDFSVGNGIFITKSLEETEFLAIEFAKKLHGGEVILLNGTLGAGKTTFTKGLAKGLGIDQNVTSPTFTIMKEYVGKYKLCHVDMYRIESADELEELGLKEVLYDSENVCVIEWNKFDDLREIIKVDIEYIGENERKFVVEGLL